MPNLNRHTLITNLCKAEVSPKMAQALARHSDIGFTMTLYSHVDLGDQSAAIRKLPAGPSMSTMMPFTPLSKLVQLARAAV